MTHDLAPPTQLPALPGEHLVPALFFLSVELAAEK
jgi:hypothetical protein